MKSVTFQYLYIIQSIEERVKKHMQVVSEAEQKLAALQNEKEKVQFYHRDAMHEVIRALIILVFVA